MVHHDAAWRCCEVRPVQTAAPTKMQLLWHAPLHQVMRLSNASVTPHCPPLGTPLRCSCCTLPQSHQHTAKPSPCSMHRRPYCVHSLCCTSAECGSGTPAAAAALMTEFAHKGMQCYAPSCAARRACRQACAAARALTARGAGRPAQGCGKTGRAAPCGSRRP